MLPPTPTCQITRPITQKRTATKARKLCRRKNEMPVWGQSCRFKCHNFIEMFLSQCGMFTYILTLSAYCHCMSQYLNVPVIHRQIRHIMDRKFMNVSQTTIAVCISDFLSKTAEVWTSSLRSSLSTYCNKFLFKNTAFVKITLDESTSHINYIFKNDVW